jgi:uncharacterized protein (TIGR02646 family)
MHYVDRGKAPRKLARIRAQLTPKWVASYPTGSPTKPSDSRWREFREALARAFNDICGYCEEWCRGEVDHFRPKTRFPDLVYDWNNWVFACNSCNLSKSDKWPEDGYVAPCAQSTGERAEVHFQFDHITGEILPRANLQGLQYARALNTIHDIDLNAFHHLKKRQARQKVVREIAKLLPSLSAAEKRRTRQCIQSLAHNTSELSSITLAELTRLGL